MTNNDGNNTAEAGSHYSAHPMQREFEQCRDAVEKRLTEFFAEHNERKSYSRLLDSMRYSLLAGGKRIRAVLCMKFCEAAGGAMESALDAACAIEMIHAYSLIHDDLPCMDDDDMRRGQPANHIEFGVSTATLAGDALQAAAFKTLLDSKIPPEAAAEMGRVLAQAAGPHGICAGQYLDLSEKGKSLSLNEIEEIHRMKTAALISASAKIGVIAAGGTPEQQAAAESFAAGIGLAFQIRDDLLDRSSTSDKLGKPVGSDEKNKKNTFAEMLGADECEKIIREETQRAVKALDDKFTDPGFLIWFAMVMAERKY
jgi:geranylgeranyl diphosphate synthase type II